MTEITAPVKHPELRELYLRYGSCMAYIAVESGGDEGIGSAFHVGEGIFVTARHVLEAHRIKEMRLTDTDLFYKSELFPKDPNGSYSIRPDTPRICEDFDGLVEVVGGPWFHPDPMIDIAAVKVSGIKSGAHFVPLGGHLDDWVGAGQFELSEALVLGYPPIPFTRSPALIAVASYVSAVVDLDIGRRSQMHFLLSAMPRGGFSGGLAFSRWGFALGVVTQSLLNQEGPAELGYFATTSIEAVYVCLSNNGILPKAQADGWDGLWDADP